MPPSTPFDRLDANFAASNGAFIATSKTGEVLEARDLYITNTGLALGDFNQVFVKRPTYKVEATLDRGARYFEDKQLPYRFCVRADLAKECRELLLPRGYTELESMPGMRLAPIPDRPAAPLDLAIRCVDDAETLEHFQKTAFAGFGLPVEAAPLFLTREFLERSGVALFVGYADGEPASTASVVATSGVAGIYWVATLERFRGRGYGAALTWEAMRAGRDGGCDVASLQASKLGFPVYERMGFENDRDYARFASPQG